VLSAMSLGGATASSLGRDRPLPRGGDLRLLLFHVDAVEPRRVEAKDLLLRLGRQLDARLLGDIGRQLEGHELVDEPFRGPDPVVAAIEDLVLTDPEQEFRDDVGEIAWPRVDERQGHGKASIDIRLLRRDPAEIVETRQATMLDNEIQIL